MLGFATGLLMAAIALEGVTGEALRAHAYFDSYNVRLGDPMILTVEFIGSAEFADLHPPALSKETDRTLWRVDDRSAKTDTYQNARRLVYRVRPLKEGVLEFPPLAFEYDDPDGAKRTVSTVAMPVHVKPGAQVALAGIDEDRTDLPMPDGLHVPLEGSPWGSADQIGDDELFRWRRACRTPKAASFAPFAFPEAKLNEAACHVLEGNWAKALRVYSALEWRIGQTPEIERGIVAALARRNDGPAELPVWRQVLRPVLRHAWPGRAGLALGVLAAVFLVLKLLGRMIRAFACLAFALVALGASAQGTSADPFAEMERMMQRMFSGASAFPGAGGMSVNGRPLPKIEVSARVRLDRTDLRVGEPFAFVLEIEGPKSATFEQLRLTPSEMYGLVVLGATKNLPTVAGANPSNEVRRLSFPVRYDVPFSSPVSFRVEGQAVGRADVRVGRNSRSTFSYSQSFAVDCPPVRIDVKPLPEDGQPADFSGIVGEGFRLRRIADRTRVETNDVVVVKSVLEFSSGFVPQGAVANEIERRPGRVVWEGFSVADGRRRLPDVALSVYDTSVRGYRTVSAQGPLLAYTASDERSVASVAVDAVGATSEGFRALKVRFAPSDESPVVTTLKLDGTADLVRGGVSGEWTRVTGPTGSGWVRTEALR